MSPYFYILDERGEPIPELDLIKWGRWMQKKDRIVKRERVGEQTVSTVFLGLDHGFSLHGPPILWETMVFPECELCQRCGGSREQAGAMHKEMVERVRSERGAGPVRHPKH